MGAVDEAVEDEVALFCRGVRDSGAVFGDFCFGDDGDVGGVVDVDVDLLGAVEGRRCVVLVGGAAEAVVVVGAASTGRSSALTPARCKYIIRQLRLRAAHLLQTCARTPCCAHVEEVVTPRNLQGARRVGAGDGWGCSRNSLRGLNQRATRESKRNEAALGASGFLALSGRLAASLARGRTRRATQPLNGDVPNKLAAARGTPPAPEGLRLAASQPEVTP